MEIFIMGIKGTNILQIDKISTTENTELHGENKDVFYRLIKFQPQRTQSDTEETKMYFKIDKISTTEDAE
ncbi:MAG: hypothetical protein KatS3mg028_0711 [Bacteroidia bacterium]|nr:MAG: hypothetical protein KatS3mg028_0711 [Bacteroidia bacterium]